MTDIAKDALESGFLLVVLNEEQYGRMYGLVKYIKKTNERACYVCISRPYEDIVRELEERKIDTGNFIFIDVLSSHYKIHDPMKNCIFLPSPADTESIRDAIMKAIENGCSEVILDAVSALLEYNGADSILHFTNGLVLGNGKNVKKVFVVLKESGLLTEDIDMLVNDLEMFADRKIDLTDAGK